MRFLPAIAVLLVATEAHAQRPNEQPRGSSERVTCSIAAGVKFGVPVNIVLAIAQIEGGRPGQWVRNRNGSYDVGPLQFNTRYLDHLQRHYGITAADVAAAGCYSYELAAWRLRKHLEFDRGDQWTRIANYHSRSPAENERYRAKVIRAAATWARWLSEHVGGGGGVHEQQVVAVEVRAHRSERGGAPKRARRRTADTLADDGVPTGEDADVLRELVGADTELLRTASASKHAHAHMHARTLSGGSDDEPESAKVVELLGDRERLVLGQHVEEVTELRR